jgi:hypothetical protein
MFGNSSLGNVAGAPVHIKYGGPAILRLEDSTSANLVYDLISDEGVGFKIKDITAGADRFTITTGGATTSCGVHNACTCLQSPIVCATSLVYSGATVSGTCTCGRTCLRSPYLRVDGSSLHCGHTVISSTANSCMPLTLQSAETNTACIGVEFKSNYGGAQTGCFFACHGDTNYGENVSYHFGFITSEASLGVVIPSTNAASGFYTGSGNSYLTNTCVKSPLVCATSCVKSPIVKATTSICLAGSNTRLFSNGYRVLEGNSDGTVLQVAETYDCTRIYGKTFACTCLQSPIVCGTSCVDACCIVAAGEIIAVGTITSANNVCASSAVCSPIVCGTTYVRSPIVCGTTCVYSNCVYTNNAQVDVCLTTPIVCATTCVQATTILRASCSSLSCACLVVGTGGFVPVIKPGGANTDLRICTVGGGGWMDFHTNSAMRLCISTAGVVCAPNCFAAGGCVCAPIVCATTCLCSPVVCATGGGWSLRTGGCIYSSGVIRGASCFCIGECMQVFATSGGLRFRRLGTGTDVGLQLSDVNDNWRVQLYGSSGAYGFLDAAWGNWDLKKQVNSNFCITTGSSGFTCSDGCWISPLVCATSCIRTCLVKTNILEQNAGASTLCIRTESGTNKDIVISPHGTGTTCIQGNLCVTGNVIADGMEGDELTSVSCRTTISCFNTSCITGNSAVYDVFVSVNPNCDGSSSYRDIHHLTTYVTTGWSGSSVCRYINSVQNAAVGGYSGGAGGAGACASTQVSAVLHVGGTQAQSFADGCATCLAILICGGQSGGTNCCRRAAECVVIKRIL